ncbi:MAG: hypothetical protein KGJ60_01040 [Verrucomicrobiota bacterium]|nr:hypothetical protein [Verrucomicrobiota bacterium]
MKSRIARIFCLILLAALADNWTLRAQTNAGAPAVSATNAAADTTNAIKTATPPSTPAMAGTNAPVPAKPPLKTVITADGPFFFDFAHHTVLYREHVLVDAPDLKLRCEWLFATLQQPNDQPTNILAETNVVIDATDDKGQKMHATADKAVYVYAVQNGVTNKTVTLTGHATAENSQITLTGETIVWDGASNTLSVPSQPKVVYRENLNGAVLPAHSPGAETNPASSGTNGLSAPRTNDE